MLQESEPQRCVGPCTPYELPFDVWLAISQYLSVGDIVSVQASSKLLRTYMDERSVWHSALLDILSVKPLPHLRAEIPQLTTQELKRTCLRAATVEQAFSRGELKPRVAYTAEGDFVQACLLPGGERYITITARGSLELRDVICAQTDTELRTQPVASFPAPDVAPAKTDIRILPKTVRDVLVLHAVHWNNDPGYDGHTDTEFRIYELKDDVLSLLRVYRPHLARNVVHYALHLHAGIPALVHLRGRYEREYVVEIHFLHPNGLDQNITVRLRGWIMCSYMQDFLPLYGSVSLISPSRLLLAASEGIYLYDIPPPPSPGAPPEVIDLKPIWNTYSRWLTRTPLISQPVLYTDPLPRARCMLWTGKDVFDLDFPLGRAAEDSRYMLHVVHQHYNHAAISMGFSSGFQYPSVKRIVTPAFSLAYGRGYELGPGHVRLGRTETRVRKARVESENFLGSTEHGVAAVGDVSVDELSGRLAIVRGSIRRLEIYDIA